MRAEAGADKLDQGFLAAMATLDLTQVVSALTHYGGTYS